MADIKKIPPLDWQTPMVDPQTGNPSAQFLRLWQEMFQNSEDINEDVVGKADKATLIETTAPLNGGGDLSEDRVIGHDESGATPGIYGDTGYTPKITVDEFGHVTDVVDIPAQGGIELEEAGVPIAGGPFSTLNFNSGATIVDATGGVADITIAGGGGGGALVKIGEIIVSTPTGTLTFPTIPAGYRDLELRLTGRGTTAASFTDVRLRVNNDTGANYDAETLDTNGTTTPAEQQQLAGTFLEVGWISDSTSPANAAGNVSVTIFDYASTTYQKTFDISSALKTGTASGGLWSKKGAGFWRNTAAITRIDVFGSGNFAAGTVLTLYGRGGSGPGGTSRIINVTALRKSTAQSIPHNIGTKLTWNAVQCDDSSSFDGVDDVLIPLGCVRFRATAMAGWTGNGTGDRIMAISKGGFGPPDLLAVSYIGGGSQWESAVPVDAGWLAVDGVNYIAGVTNLAVWVQQTSGGALACSTGWSQPNFCVEFDMGP